MKRTVRTREEFLAARLELGLTGEGLADILCADNRTIRRIENTDQEYSSRQLPLFCRVLEWMLNTGFRPPEFKRRHSPKGRLNKVTK